MRQKITNLPVLIANCDLSPTNAAKVLRVMQANGSPEPRFESDDERSSFLIRLPVHEGFVGEVTPEVTGDAGTKSGPSRDQVLVLQTCEEESPVTDLMALAGRSNRTKFREAILTPLLVAGLVEMTIPDKPRSRLQKYRLTGKGKAWLNERQ